MRLSRLLAGAALMLALVPIAAMAQAQAPAAPAPGAAPAAGSPGTLTDNKPVGDWTARCFSVTSQSPCDMYEELDDKNSHQRVVSVSIAYVPSTDRHVAQIAVPLGVAIAQGLTIKTDSYTSPKLPFRRCDQSGCYVETIMPNDIIDSLAKSGPDASVNIVADDGKPYALRLSLNGFAGAHDAMETLAKEKAGKAPAAAAPAKK